MDNFVVGAMAENCYYILRSSPRDPPQLLGPVIGKAPSKLLASFAAEGDDVPFLKIAFDSPYTNCQ